MPSTRDNRPGTGWVSTPRYPDHEIHGRDAALADLAAQSEAAAALLADELHHDVDLSALVEESRRAADLLTSYDLPPDGSQTSGGFPKEGKPMPVPVPTGIHSSDVIRLLQSEGFDVGPWTLRYAARRQRIPEPFKTASGDHAWKAADLPVIRQYLRNPVRPGRPRKTT